MMSERGHSRLLDKHVLVTVRKIRPPGELMRKDKLVEISGGKCIAADVSTAAAAIIKANDARGVAVTSA